MAASVAEVASACSGLDSSEFVQKTITKLFANVDEHPQEEKVCGGSCARTFLLECPALNACLLRLMVAVS